MSYRMTKRELQHIKLHKQAKTEFNIKKEKGEGE